MANYQTLKAAINAVIKANGNKEITGTVLNEVLLAMVNSLGAGYQFMGVATPSTNPGTPDQNVFYIAGQAGTYTNFNSIALLDGVSILKWNGSWSSETVVAGDGVFDISAYKATGGTLATFADLSAALDGGNNIPQSLRKGGMSVKFVQTSDNKYVQFRYMGTAITGSPNPFLNTNYWQKQASEKEVIKSTLSNPIINELSIDGSIQLPLALEVNKHYFITFTLDSPQTFAITLRSASGSLGQIVQTIAESQTWQSGETMIEFECNATKGNYLRIGESNIWSHLSDIRLNGLLLDDVVQLKAITENIENLQNVNVDISQYIKFDKRVDTTGEVTDNNYAYIKLPVSLLTVGKTYYFKGKSEQYVPGVIVQRGEDYFVATYEDDILYTIKDTDTYININLNKVYGNLGIALSSYKVAEINKEVYSKSQTDSAIDAHINSVTEGTEYNIVETDCEFFINKRYINDPNIPIQSPIDANGYVCARFTNIDVTKIYAADCISSQYVPGYMLLDENDIILAQGDPYGSVVYNKQILPIKDSSYKTVLLQAKVDTTNVNELTVKNILRLFIKENIKSVYSSGEIDNKLYQRDVKIKNLEDTQLTEEEYKINQNHWFDKSIAWFGTSIPEGGVWTGGPTYPNKVGSMLGAALLNNEAVGGSCAANLVSGNTSFKYWYIRMGHSVAQNIDLFRDAYTVDYTNQTVTTGPRTMIDSLNLSSVPNITTYAQAVDLIAAMAGCSYQIKLVHRYLLADDNERTAYLNQIFNGYENELNALQNISQWSVYKNTLQHYDIDLIVFDHGHNDNPSPVADAQFDDEQTNDIDTIDMSTWLGAMNTYMRLVMFYKPKMRIVQISDYYYGNTVKSQEQFARRWQIPYCEVWKSLPYLYNRFKVTVRGYWDANGIWYDKGFTWIEPTNMSDTNISNYTNLVANAYELKGAGGYGTGTIGALKTNINPRQENGEWVWETNLCNIFMKDGLHPGSDYTWKCVDLYTRILAQFIKGI